MENVSDGIWSDDASSTVIKMAVISRTAMFVQIPNLKPLPFLLRTKPIDRRTTFPRLSPLSSSKEKGNARAKLPSEGHNDSDTDCSGKRGGPKLFLMSLEVVAYIARRSTSQEELPLRGDMHPRSGYTLFYFPPISTYVLHWRDDSRRS